MDKLEFFNSMHIRNRFDLKTQGRDPTESWRSMLLEYLPEELKETIKTFDSFKMRKIMDLMKIRIHFFKDMKNHTYFFRTPIYDSSVAEKFLVKLK
jgi:hypothetical protein